MRTHFSIYRSFAMVTCLVFALPAWSHHILGTPHYAYDEEYPQTPILTYSAEQGAYDVNMTCYPGKPQPGDNTSLHFYIKHRETGKPFSDTVTLTVFHDRLIGEDPVVYGPIEGELEEAMFKFFPRFELEANYTIRLEYEADGAPWILDLPIVAGEPGSPWKVVGTVAIAMGAFVVVIRAIRIKRARREAEAARINERGEAVEAT